uniref:Tetraspanin n=1 Tax=Plectus sambesii TaxID=2011161 RepID=A0A914XBJ7_9BILA
MPGQFPAKPNTKSDLYNHQYLIFLFAELAFSLVFLVILTSDLINSPYPALELFRLESQHISSSDPLNQNPVQKEIAPLHSFHMLLVADFVIFMVLFVCVISSLVVGFCCVRGTSNDSPMGRYAKLIISLVFPFIAVLSIGTLVSTAILKSAIATEVQADSLSRIISELLYEFAEANEAGFANLESKYQCCGFHDPENGQRHYISEKGCTSSDSEKDNCSQAIFNRIPGSVKYLIAAIINSAIILPLLLYTIRAALQNTVKRENERTEGSNRSEGSGSSRLENAIEMQNMNGNNSRPLSQTEDDEIPENDAETANLNVQNNGNVPETLPTIPEDLEEVTVRQDDIIVHAAMEPDEPRVNELNQINAHRNTNFYVCSNAIPLLLYFKYLCIVRIVGLMTFLFSVIALIVGLFERTKLLACFYSISEILLAALTTFLGCLTYMVAVYNVGDDIGKILSIFMRDEQHFCSEVQVKLECSGIVQLDTNTVKYCAKNDSRIQGLPNCTEMLEGEIISSFWIAVAFALSITLLIYSIVLVFRLCRQRIRRRNNITFALKQQSAFLINTMKTNNAYKHTLTPGQNGNFSSTMSSGIDFPSTASDAPLISHDDWKK